MKLHMLGHAHFVEHLADCGVNGYSCTSGGHGAAGRVRIRVKISDRSPLTAALRFRLTGPVSPVTGRNKTNANLNSNSPVETVLTGIPAG